MTARCLHALWATLLIAGTPAGATNGAAVAVTPQSGTPFQASDSGPGAVQVAGGANDGFGSAGEASAFADSGVIKIKGSAAGAITAASSASFGDLLTITSPEVFNGTQGALSFSVAVSGKLSASGGNVTWRLQALVPAGALFNALIDKSGAQFVTGYLGDPFGTYFGVLPFVYGQPTSLTVNLRAAATSFIEAGAGFDLSRSLYWNGISDVTARGVPVGAFEVTSQSGTDYRGSFVPVPEPATLLLFVAGLLWLTPRALTRRDFWHR